MEEETKMKKKMDSSSSSSSDEVVRWERTVLRVLLVESDDSTRQIITSLLRKCDYRVVAVPDGLKAWETLKRRPHNIDLILTEVDLPSISGYALLSLITEHDICKNIPVIMMSTQDSVSFVLKCMLKGAADFLVKPVRRNELKNLWRHVWRRETQAVGCGTKETTATQNKVEATSENNASSNHSSDYLAFVENNNECSEKGSDAQSSCTTPYVEAKSAHMPNMQGLSQLKCSSESNLSQVEQQEVCMVMDDTSVVPKPETGGKLTTFELESDSYHMDDNSTSFRLREHGKMIGDASVGPESHLENIGITREIHCHDDELVEPSSRAIDLIGKFDNLRTGIYGLNCAYDGVDKFYIAPQLELTLRRFHDGCSKIEESDARHSLNHSNASAFSWYDNRKTLQRCFLTLGSDQQFENAATLFVGKSGFTEAAFPGPQFGTVPVSAIGFDNACSGYSQVIPPVVNSQAGIPQAWIPPPGPQDLTSSEIHSSEKGQYTCDGLTNGSADPTVRDEDSNFESCGDLCDGSVSKINTSGCGSVCDASDGDLALTTAVERTASESVNDNDNRALINDGFRGIDSNRSAQREAALMKYRLKRKERHFEKKVRYESRKRLAEQRPRVKGQFVRRVQQIDPSPSSTIDTLLAF